MKPYSKVELEQTLIFVYAALLLLALHNTSETNVINPGNRNKGKGNGAGVPWESQPHCFVGKFGNPYTHSFGTDTQHDYSHGNCRTFSSILIKLE